MRAWGLSRKYPAVLCEKWRPLLKKIQETLYTGQWHLSPLQNRHLVASHSSLSFSSTVQNMVLSLLWLYCPFFGCGEPGDVHWEGWALVSGSQLWTHNSSPVMTFWEEIWKSLATAAQCSFCSGSRSCRMHFATTHFTPRSCVKILDMVVFGIPRSAPSSHTVGGRSLWIAARTRSISQVFCLS